MASTLLSKIVFKNSIFCQKLKILYISDNAVLFKFASMWSRYVTNNVWRDFTLSVSVIATVARKSCNGKFSAKIDLPTGPQYVIITDPDIGSLKSLHTLFDNYLDHMLVKLE